MWSKSLTMYTIDICMCKLWQEIPKTSWVTSILYWQSTWNRGISSRAKFAPENTIRFIFRQWVKNINCSLQLKSQSYALGQVMNVMIGLGSGTNIFACISQEVCVQHALLNVIVLSKLISTCYRCNFILQYVPKICTQCTFIVLCCGLI